MKLAVITDEISQDFAHALDVMGEYGVTGAELRGLWNTNVADLSDAQVATAKEELARRKMHAAALATPFYKCDIEVGAPNAGEAAGHMHLARPIGLDEQIALLNRCIRVAQALDTTYLRVFSFWRKEAMTPEIEARIAAAFAEPLKLASEAGITLLLENEYACFVGTGVETARVVSAIGSPYLGVVWDPGNAFNAGERAYPDGYEAVKRWVQHVHIKDARMVENANHEMEPHWCVVGAGEVNIQDQIEALHRDGYKGYVSLETHWIPETGSGPDGRGLPEDGSRACLTALRQMIDSLGAA